MQEIGEITLRYLYRGESNDNAVSFNNNTYRYGRLKAKTSFHAFVYAQGTLS